MGFENLDDSTKDEVPQKLVFDLASACIFSSLPLLLLYVLFSGYSDWSFLTFFRFLSVLLGLASLFAVCIRLINKRIGLILFASYFLLSLFNFEHILVNNSNLNIFFGHFSIEGAFRDSILNLKLFLHLLIFLTTVMVSLGLSHLIKLRLFLIVGILTSTLLIDFFAPNNPLIVPWIQRNLLIENLGAIDNSSSQNLIEYTDVPVNAKGELVISPIAKRPKKVVLIIVEGMSQVHIENGLMHKLKSWQEKGLFVHSFVSHQKQTNRGLFSLLCGELPNLINNESKSDLLSANKIGRNCLPRELSKVGFTNYFLQSAPLEFMNKAQFAKRVGFNYVVGANEFDSSKLISSWGVADETILAASLDILRKKGESQFVTILTSNTHHPYVTSRGRGSFKNAIQHIDGVLDSYIKKVLEEFKEPPLIVITSDEAFVESKSLPQHFSNWSTLLFLYPSLDKKKISQPFGQKDFAGSMVDLLNIKDSDFPHSRSILREYKDRKIVFSNVYTKKVFHYDGNNLLTCDFAFNCRKQPIGANLFGFPSYSEAVEAPHDLTQMIYSNDISFSRGDIIFEKEDVRLSGGEERVLFSELKIHPKSSMTIRFVGTKNFIKSFGVYICGKAESKEDFITSKESITLPGHFRDQSLCLSLALKNSDKIEKFTQTMTVFYE